MFMFGLFLIAVAWFVLKIWYDYLCRVPFDYQFVSDGKRYDTKYMTFLFTVKRTFENHRTGKQKHIYTHYYRWTNPEMTGLTYFYTTRQGLTGQTLMGQCTEPEILKAMEDLPSEEASRVYSRHWGRPLPYG
jgi:hypothetical protein